MTRNLFTQLADMAEYHIRWGRSFVSRERAADLMSDWDAFSESDELQAEILSRFPSAEPPSVPGLDFLPAVEADAATLVAEAVAVLDEPTFCTDVYVGNEGEFKCTLYPHDAETKHWDSLAEFGWPVEVTDGVDALIERSSLGTPEAVALREQTDDATARRIVARSKAFGAWLERANSSAEQEAAANVDVSAQLRALKERAESGEQS